MEQKLYTIIVHSENVAGVLNQVTAVFTRRQINIESLNVSASSIPGVHKYTITAMTDPDTMEKVAKQISKKIDVVQTQYYTDDDVFQHEIALYNVRQSERKERDPGDSSFGRGSALRDPWCKTMVIVSEYELEYNEENSVFG